MNKRSLILACCALVALTFAESSQTLQAKSPDEFVASAKDVLQSKLLDPLQEKEDGRSRYTRAVLPPSARRIRILEKTPQKDAQGHPFVTFAIDESRGLGGDRDKEANWFKDAIAGCVYPVTGTVMVKRGDVYYASSMLLGKRTPVAPADTCRAL